MKHSPSSKRLPYRSLNALLLLLVVANKLTVERIHRKKPSSHA